MILLLFALVIFVILASGGIGKILATLFGVEPTMSDEQWRARQATPEFQAQLEQFRRDHPNLGDGS